MKLGVMQDIQKKVWVDIEIKTTKDAFLTGLSTGAKNPSGKGKRFIITHIGSDSGFLEGGLLLFESKKTSDYHEEMNGEVFQEWFRKILATIGEGSVIVMDNAPYHSVRSENIPNMSWRKQNCKLVAIKGGSTSR